LISVVVGFTSTVLVVVVTGFCCAVAGLTCSVVVVVDTGLGCVVLIVVHVVV